MPDGLAAVARLGRLHVPHRRDACATGLMSSPARRSLSVAPLRSRLVKSVHRRDACATWIDVHAGETVSVRRSLTVAARKERSQAGRLCHCIGVHTGGTVLFVAPLRSRLVKSAHRRDACATALVSTQARRSLSVAPLRSRLVKSVHRRGACATALVSTQAGRFCSSLPYRRGS